MGSRSRKRGRTAPAARPAQAPGAPQSTATRSQARAPAAAPRTGPAVRDTEGRGPEPTAPRADRSARSEAKNAAVRAELQPIAPGQRPLPLVIAVAVATVLALSNLVAYALGTEIQGQRPAFAGVAGFAGLMLIAAGGMWRLKYWALLGFQSLLGLVILVFSLLLMRAANVLAVVVCVAIVGLAGWLFWKLVRVLARVQMPQRP